MDSREQNGKSGRSIFYRGQAGTQTPRKSGRQQIQQLNKSAPVFDNTSRHAANLHSAYNRRKFSYSYMKHRDGTEGVVWFK